MCEACRQALSARLDGEGHPAQRAAVDGHMESCGECRRWYEDAATITRLARTAPAVPGRGVPDSVLGAAPTARRARVARALRLILGGLGLAQFLLGVTQITALAGQSHVHAGQVASAGHLWHESAAWNLAIGAGFASIAARRGRPSAIVPMLTVFVVMLSLLSAADVLSGRVEAPWLLSHGILLAGYVIVVLLARPTLDIGDPPGGGWRRRWSLRLGGAGEDAGACGEGRAERARPVRATPDVAVQHRRAA